MTKQSENNINIDLSILEPLLQDPDVTEVMVNGTDAIYVEKYGQLERTKITFETEDDVVAVIRAIAGSVGREVSESNPVVDARLADGTRFNAVIRPIAVTGPTMTLRKFSRPGLGWDDLVRFGSLTGQMRDFLQACIKARINTLVAGGTASGKTTILNALTEFIPDNERVVSVEATVELQPRNKHLISLEARPANPQGEGEISVGTLIRNAQMMRPDRIITGEISEQSVWDLLHVMTNGYDGSMFAMHADNVQDVLDRLEIMATVSTGLPLTQIRARIAQGVKLITQQNYMPNKRRRITSVTEITGLKQGQYETREIFRFVPDEQDGRIVMLDRPTFADRLDLPADFFSTSE